MSKKDLKFALLAIIFFMIVIAAFVQRAALGAIAFSGRLLILIGWAALMLKKIKKDGKETTGNVIDIETDNDGDTIPVIEFRTQEGEIVQGKPFISTSMNINGILLKNKQLLKEVKVIYYRQNPSKFILPEYSFQNTTALIFISLGILTILVLGLYDLFIK